MAKDALRETLNGLKRANSLARSENQEQINKANAQASALPVTERQLLGIERKFRLNDELYTFLLETRAEQEMQKASNRADSEVIDPADARFSALVSPNSAMISLVAFFSGFALPLLIISLNFLFNKKLKDEDIKMITDIPVVGNIPHYNEKSNTVVFDDPSSTISEAFRILRSKMQFLTKETKAPVILITSAMPEDGKTFIAINLASVYSLLGRKTVLIGFDLRKPKIFQKILITGGASGIGLGLAERFVRENNKVIICGRRESVLKEAAEKFPSIFTRQCDLSIPEERIELFNWILKEHDDLNVLVNNAGIQQRMSLSDDHFYSRAKDEIIINVEAPVHLISLFLKLRKLDAIINVTSGLSFVPMVTVPVYSASKAFFHSFTLSLRHLIKADSIEVIEIIPPALNTDLGGKGIHNYAPPVGEFIESVFEQLKQGKTEITFGFTDAMIKSGPEELQKAFERMNQPR